MKKTLLTASLAAALLGTGCAQDDAKLRTYDNNDLELAVGNAAKMNCTCRFVMLRDEAYCADWVRASPNVARFAVDEANKTVVGTAFVSWTAKARYVDDKHGCVLE